MDRKLVTLRTVSEIRPIAGADLIELALIDGWQCVVKKGEFKAGYPGLYFEIDSFLPSEDERFKFLEPRFIKWDGRVGARIKTMKLRGELSQGLLLPLNDFPEAKDYIDNFLVAFGEDATIEDGRTIYDLCFDELLKVVKWEKPLAANLAGVARGNFPSFIPKTDQERVQNIRDLHVRFGDQEFEESTKMDGSSMTVYHVHDGTDRWLNNVPRDNEGQPLIGHLQGVCSRNLDLVETEGNLFWKLARQHQVIEKLQELGQNLAIQGELVGSSIQGNFEGFPEGHHDFYVYNVFDIDQQLYLPPAQARQLVADLGLNYVPYKGTFKLNDIAKSVAELLERADHKGINGKTAEGHVYKAVSGDFSFKAISNKYLLKTDS
jgi:RNA ligase (TIGR02306 family)